MGGYSFLKRMHFKGVFYIGVASAILPCSIQEYRSITLKPDVIKADRSSPAFSALEDILSLQDRVLQVPQIEDKKEKASPKNLIKLKGMKVSVRHSKYMQKVVLGGEKIDVAHFTKRFIESSPRQIQLAQVQPQWQELEKRTIRSALSKKEQVTLSSGVVISKLSSRGPSEKREAPFKSVELSQASQLSKDVYGAFDVKGKISIAGGDFSKEEGFQYHIEHHDSEGVRGSFFTQADSDQFKIQVGALKGFLYLELRDAGGRILANGEAELPSSRQDLFKGLNVILEPSADVFAGRIQKGAAQQVAGVKEAWHGDAEGKVDYEGFAPGSVLASSVSQEGHFSEQKTVELGGYFYSKLMSKKQVRSLSEKLDLYGESIEINSLVVGRVLQSGLPHSGLKVRLYEGLSRPVYKDQYGEPRPQLTESSQNGGFIFYNLDPGGHLIQVLGKQGEVLAQRWFLVKEGHVARGSLEVAKPQVKLAKLKEFPSQSQPYTGILNEWGLSKSVVINSQSRDKVATVTGPVLSAFALQSADHHKEHIYVKPSHSLEMQLPVVKQEWLEQFLNENRSNMNPDLGLVVGFVEDQDFNVELEHSQVQTDQSAVLYFDHNGRAMETGRAGGGFVITNTRTDLDFKPVAINQKGEILSKLVKTEPRAISIF